jgi:hypothetical protein
LEGKIAAGGGQCGNECVFEHLDGAFCRIYSMVVWFHQLECAPGFGEKLFDELCGLIIHYVHLWFAPLGFYHFEVSFVRFKNAFDTQVCNQSRNYCVIFVMVHHKKHTLPSNDMNGKLTVKLL